jgi:ABC-type tungstate transport system permease subunit
VKRFDVMYNDIDWILSAEGQNAIRSYKINGEQLFFPNAATDMKRRDEGHAIEGGSSRRR